MKSTSDRAVSRLDGTLYYPSAKEAEVAYAGIKEASASALQHGVRLANDAIIFAVEVPASLERDAERGLASALEAASTGAVVQKNARGGEQVRRALGSEFWTKRWQEGQIGFHEGRANDLLVKYIDRIESRRMPARILVPLCGKSCDLKWLADRGHEVVGVELAFQAVEAFFDEQKLTPERVEIGGHRALRSKHVTLVCGDFFDVANETLGQFDAVYDRAALVALQPEARGRYVETCRRRLVEGGLTLLVALAYDQSLASGPPWSIDEQTVREVFAERSIASLETRDVSVAKRLADAGIASLKETAYLIG